MLEALLAQLFPCEQPTCNAIDALIKITYAVVVTAAIVAIIYFVRKRTSDRKLR
jgi:hypothetical protein